MNTRKQTIELIAATGITTAQLRSLLTRSPDYRSLLKGCSDYDNGFILEVLRARLTA